MRRNQRPRPFQRGGLITPDDLARGELEVLGLLPAASNYTLLARLLLEDREELVVYKPMEGETPLWDFPEGTLCRREVAAYLVSEAGEWGFVPPTILRQGPFGAGAVQAFVEHDPRVTAFDVGATHRADLRAIALYDFVVNNADRKASHVLLDGDRRIWAVDHGVCFHTDFKLRTVLWDFAGEPISPAEAASLDSLNQALGEGLSVLLSTLLEEPEVRAVEARIGRLLSEGVFPTPGPGRPYPWPPV